MKGKILIFIFISFFFSTLAQIPLRPDAFPPIDEPSVPSKALLMASNVDQMAQWNRYPTHSTYLSMMQEWADNHPELCRLDSIGTSVQGRKILCLAIGTHLGDSNYPEFFYSSTIHGDELTGMVMMLRLIDTLLNSYGRNPRLTHLVDSLQIYINPLANPDGTYHGGDNTVATSWRYNADGIDLNRNYPDPFSSTTPTPTPENTAMIDYVSHHRFRLSANLHGGAEVLNYPWDSFLSSVQAHPKSDWWQEVCTRFMDTLRCYDTTHFANVTSSGYIAGGDWYVIGGGRQDYMNYYHDCLEMTMEISTTKRLPSHLLPSYWHFLAGPLITYIEELLSLLPHDSNDIAEVPDGVLWEAYPNPTSGHITLLGVTPGDAVSVLDLSGATLLHSTSSTLDLSHLAPGIYLVRYGRRAMKVIKTGAPH